MNWESLGLVASFMFGFLSMDFILYKLWGWPTVCGKLWKLLGIKSK